MASSSVQTFCNNEGFELAQNAFIKIEGALEQNGGLGQMRFLSPKADDGSTLVNKRAVFLDSHAKVVGNMADYDFTLSPSAPAIIGCALLSDIFKRELRQLDIVNKEFSGNSREEEEHELSQHERMMNMTKVTEGLKQDAQAVWDEDPDMEFKSAKKMKRRLSKALHSLLDQCYPDDREEMKRIFEVLFKKRQAEDYEFFQVPHDWSCEVVLLLSKALIIETNDDDFTMIRLGI